MNKKEQKGGKKVSEVNKIIRSQWESQVKEQKQKRNKPENQGATNRPQTPDREANRPSRTAKDKGVSTKTTRNQGES